MHARTILTLAAAGILAAACTSGGSAQATGPTSKPVAAVSAAPATPAPTAPPVVTPAPTRTPVPQTDGEGDEVVVGTVSNGYMERSYTSKTVGDVTELRGGIFVASQDMNDPRVTGTLRFDFSVDIWAKAGREYGTYALANAGGTWVGTCTGGVWAEGDGVAWGCWLQGTDDYQGYTFYQTVNKELGSDPVVHGVIYEGTPPKG
jgi:hypothetical protein